VAQAAWSVEEVGRGREVAVRKGLCLTEAAPLPRSDSLKIQCFTHNKLSSPRFRNLWKYSWYKYGYMKDKSSSCINPVQFCLKDVSLGKDPSSKQACIEEIIANYAR